MADINHMYTPEGRSLTGTPWDVYPRPLLKRESFFCLNGQWEFGFGKKLEDPVFDKIINVPFCPESLLSGINMAEDDSKIRCYKRSFTLPSGFVNDRVILHFGAVDQIAEVFVNGKKQGSHVGGYQSFSFDITSSLKDENEITVLVRDELSSLILPYGKQRHNRGGMWYTPVSGIWQTVWLESVPKNHITALTTTQDPDDIIIKTEWSDEYENGKVTVHTPDGEICTELLCGTARIELDSKRLWSPEDPYLYEFEIETESDKISSYFALRTLEIKDINGYKRLLLNGKPYFFHGLLDQGYYSDGIFTPASPEGYERDILKMKALGFNMLRKHIKIEPQIFYYLCDKLGMTVFQDMVNNSDYSFVRDTALPTVGLIKKDDRACHKNKKTRKAFITHMTETVSELSNHPCICLWTIFNEGWGQFCSSEIYRKLKELDGTRFIDSASGWFRGGENDFDSRHIYFKKVKLKAGDKPLYLSEFGGFSYKAEGHVFNNEKEYGYGKKNSREEFVSAIRSLYEKEIIPLVGNGLCATVYTQVSDVEDEINGLLSYDRQVDKLFPEEFSDISEKLKI